MATYVLRHSETHADIKEKSKITHRDTRQAWRFEKIVIPGNTSRHAGQLMIKVSMYSPKLGMRVVAFMHPHMFSCVIETAEGQARHVWIVTRDQLVIPFWLAVVAYFVLVGGDMFHVEEWVKGFFR